MPSSYPARLAFVYAGMCMIYLLREASPLRVFNFALANLWMVLERMPDPAYSKGLACLKIDNHPEIKSNRMVEAA